jgi:hypothetical protein
LPNKSDSAVATVSASAPTEKFYQMKRRGELIMGILRRLTSTRRSLLSLSLCLAVGIILADRSAHQASAVGSHGKISAGMKYRDSEPRTSAT